MIIQRYLLREIGLSFIAVTLVLGLMFLSGTFVRLLAETLEGRYPSDLLFTLFALRGIGSMVLLMPFAMFIAVMLALGRLYRDSEMAVLSACGYGPRQLLKPVALAGFVVTLLVGWMALFVSPWADDYAAQAIAEAGARTGTQGINPGQFNHFEGGAVVYVERVDSAKKQLYGIFAQMPKQEGHFQLTAERGHEYTERPGGDRFLLLQNGYRYEGQYGQPEFRIIRFEEHGIRIQEREANTGERRRNTASTHELWQSRSRHDKTELQWRLAMPLSTLLLALLAVPLSKGSPRQGRLLGLFLGVLIYMAYNNLLNIARSAMQQGDVPPWFGLWWVHALVVGLILMLLWRQQRMVPPRRKSTGSA